MFGHDNITSIKLELGIAAQKMVQQVMLNNETIEKQLKQGIDLALEDVLGDGKFVEHVRQATKKEIENIVKDSLSNWEVRQSIQKMIQQKLADKIDAYAETVAAKLTEGLV